MTDRDIAHPYRPPQQRPPGTRPPASQHQPPSTRWSIRGQQRSLNCSVWRDSRIGGIAHAGAAGGCQQGGWTGPGRSFLRLCPPRRPPFRSLPPKERTSAKKTNTQASKTTESPCRESIVHGHAQGVRPWHAAWIGERGACVPRGREGSGWVELWSTQAHEHTQIIQTNSTTGSGRRVVTEGKSQQAPPPLPPAPSLHQPSHRGIPLR